MVFVVFVFLVIDIFSYLLFFSVLTFLLENSVGTVTKCLSNLFTCFLNSPNIHPLFL